MYFVAPIPHLPGTQAPSRHASIKWFNRQSSINRAGVNFWCSPKLHCQRKMEIAQVYDLSRSSWISCSSWIVTTMQSFSRLSETSMEPNSESQDEHAKKPKFITEKSREQLDASCSLIWYSMHNLKSDKNIITARLRREWQPVCSGSDHRETPSAV